MQTFSQYAATRLLRSSSARAQTFGGIALKTGDIQTFAGIDLITGMPVFIYTMPEKPSAIPEVFSEYIPSILEFGFEHDLGFVVTSSAPGYTPLKPILTQVRLEWLVRASSRALADAHSVGLIHGNLEPSHFFACGDHLLLEGWGLPWGEASPDYKAPETNISLATDVFAWARSITMFGKGKPRLMLDGEFGRLVGHCLNPRPSERPTAQELVLALEQVLPPRHPSIPDLAETALELSATEFLETETNIENPIKRTKPLDVPIPTEVVAKLEPVQKPSKPELPMPLPEISESHPIQEPVDEVSPEAKLDAIEAELALTSKSELEPITSQAEPQTMNQPELEPEAHKPNLEPVVTQSILEPVVTQSILEPVVTQTNLEPIIHKLELEVIKTPSQPEIPVIPEAKQPISEPEAAQLTEPEHLAADEPDVQLPVRASSRITDDSDADAPRPTIRIGFDEDDQSWRSVVTPEKPRPRVGRWIIIAVLIGALIVMGGILLGQPRTATNTINPRPIAVSGNPSSGSVVTFNLRGTQGIKGRLIVVASPNGSQLAVGALLATVPGPVAFPVAGEYKLRIEMPDYQPGEVTVRVPEETQVNLELPRR